MVKKCIECKYFYNPQKTGCYGTCILHTCPVKPNVTCSDFTENNVNGVIENEKLESIEKRIEKLESIVMRLL